MSGMQKEYCRTTKQRSAGGTQLDIVDRYKELAPDGTSKK